MDYNISELVAQNFFLPQRSSEGTFYTVPEMQNVIRGFTGILVDADELERELTRQGFEPATRVIRSAVTWAKNPKPAITKNGYIITIV